MFFSTSARFAATPRSHRVLILFSIALLVGFYSVPSAGAAPIRRYTAMDRVLDKCGLTSQLVGHRFGDDAPAATLCINGSLAVADPDFNRVLTNSTGTGVGTGVVGNCSLSGSGTAVNYDNYSFNLTGCAAFPTEVTITVCGPAGCQHVGNVDTILTLYRNVAAGDPLTADGGLPGVFDPANACTNARGAQDDLGTVSGTTNQPGGATCNQVVGANCVGPCTSPSAAGGLSGLIRQLGNGRFTVVVSGFGNATTGTYNLYVDAPAAGCAVALAPTAAGVSVSGRVLTAAGNGLRNAVVTMTDPQGVTQTARTSGFGYYRFFDVPAGATYVIEVASKRFLFAPRVVAVQDELTDIDFVAESTNKF